MIGAVPTLRALDSRDISPERFAEGMTFEAYLAHVATPENLAREVADGVKRSDRSAQLRSIYESYALHDYQVEAWRWLLVQPGAPAKLLVISEDWSSDCRRDVPMMARLADTLGLELRIFDRDGVEFGTAPEPDPDESPNADLMARFLNRKNGGVFQSIPVIVFYTAELRYLYHYTEYPAIYEKDRIVYGHIRVPRQGESAEDTRQRIDREFTGLQQSPFFRLWAGAGVDEITSALQRRLMLGSA